MKKLATLVFLGTVAFGVDAQAFLGFGDSCCPRTCETCPPMAVPQCMESVCGPCGEKMCCPKLGFWYNY